VYIRDRQQAANFVAKTVIAVLLLAVERNCKLVCSVHRYTCNTVPYGHRYIASHSGLCVFI